ncbi:MULTISPECIES: restriction endonuclease subunit S [Acinetobacter]|uniref:restriction endonuclease subunit S n=1 Tax=Acinetobacter TaxID=469 RepID=UPI0004531AA7|nr:MULTISPECIES: restriction endonuclease subunit S [Acinetobacter]EXB35591.1 type I restriction modification DNA specificity domain protein [Acinetobacter sp. 1461402]
MAKYQAYAEYKDSGLEWLGEIPSHWKVKKLKYLGEAIIGLTYSPDDVVDESEGTLVLRSSNIQNKKLAFEDNVYVRKEIPEKLRTQKNDILICARNGSRALIGKNALIDESAEGVSFGAFMSIFRSEYNSYLSKVFNSALFEYQSGTFLTATINQLTTGNLNSFEVPLPSLAERNQISNFLDHETTKIDYLIEKQQQLIELLKEKRQAVISHAVTKGLDPNVPMKDSGVEWLGEVPEHWTILKLSAIADITRLAGYEYTEYWQSDDEGEIIAIRGQNIRFNKLVNLDDAEKITNKLSIRLKRSRLYKNDIAYPCVGTIGNAVLIHESDKYHINQNIAKLTPNEKIYPLYLTYFLNSSICLESALFLNTSDAQPSILVGNLRKVKIAFPQLAEQIKIADSISNQLFMLDNLILKAELTISLMQERRTALISAAVTGKIDVRNWKAPRVAEANTELSA